ncbi:hypothetical protein EDB85DRAFT_1020965 [Lactarius pseudohatsudake]|nr:hypothetical protein EDB85DRAFT_1020965 [Lactarius pseudohatsudake]
MPGNDDYDGSSFSESASLGALSPDRCVDLAARCDQEEYGDDFSAGVDAALPPLGVNLTGYRLLNMTIVFSFGIIKGILTYMGQSTAPTTLDWVGGALLAVALYWVGLYEQRDAKKWEWFFQVDLAPGIDYYAKRVVGGAMGVLFSLRGALAITSLSSLPVFLLAHFISHVPLDAWLGVYVGFSTRRIRGRVWGWQRAVDFVEDYGPGTPLAEQHEWFGAVGAIVGFFCGTALVWSPLAVVYFYLT